MKILPLSFPSCQWRYILPSHPSAFSHPLWVPALLLSLLIVAGCASLPTLPSGSEGTDERPDAALGVELAGIRLTSGGYMIDFRYRVLAPEKAAPLFDRKVAPYLIHEKTGSKFAVPAPAKVGPLRQTTLAPEAGRQYFILFANPGKYMARGDLVTVVVGDVRFEHLQVE